MTHDIDNNPWLELHYESGQVPMLEIRKVFTDLGLDVGKQANYNDTADWNRLNDAYHLRFLDAAHIEAWKAFREACDRVGYRPVPLVLPAQEDTPERLGEAPVGAGPRVEARERMTNMPKMRLQWESIGGEAHPPQYPGDVGVDLATTEGRTIEADGGVHYVPLGVKFAAPPNTWILIIGRSSLAAKLGLGCVPGVIDNGFRGEMLAGLYTLGPEARYVPTGSRVVQAILIPSVFTSLEQVKELPPSARGENGFGSTGGHQ